MLQFLPRVFVARSPFCRKRKQPWILCSGCASHMGYAVQIQKRYNTLYDVQAFVICLHAHHMYIYIYVWYCDRICIMHKGSSMHTYCVPFISDHGSCTCDFVETWGDFGAFFEIPWCRHNVWITRITMAWDGCNLTMPQKSGCITFLFQRGIAAWLVTITEWPHFSGEDCGVTVLVELVRVVNSGFLQFLGE